MQARWGEAPSGLRVAIVEDHEFFRRGLKLLLARHGFEVVAEAGNAEDGLRLLERTRVDVVILDLHLPGMSGVEAAAALAASPSPPAVLMLTVSTRSDDLYDALAAGASGYVLKGDPGDEIARAVRAVGEGRAHVSGPMTAALVDRVRQLGGGAAGHDGEPPELTARELEILRLLSRGAPNGTIAAGLGISEHTVKSHVASILGKLRVRNRVQAATLAVRRGLV